MVYLRHAARVASFSGIGSDGQPGCASGILQRRLPPAIACLLHGQNAICAKLLHPLGRFGKGGFSSE
jgi:hypothetical protein